MSDAQKCVPLDEEQRSAAVDDGVRRWTDAYFNRTKQTIGKFGDTQVTYAIFMRRPVVAAPRLAVEWLKTVAEQRGVEVKIDVMYDEGRWVGAASR
jgi:nicotinate phosphoribosyltransferase